MATKLYCRGAASDYGTGNNDLNLRGTATGWIPLLLSLTPGAAAAQTSQNASVTGPTAGIEVFSPSTPSPAVWYSPPLAAAVAISGSIVWNIWGFEQNMTANVATNGRLEVIDGATGAITLIDQTARTVEMGVSPTSTVNNFAETPAAGVACKKGDRLRVRLFGDDAGTMAIDNFQFYIDGPTGGANGDTWLQLTENLTFAAEPAGTQVFPTDTAGPTVTPPAVPDVTLLSTFTGADENPLSEGGKWAALSTGANPLKRVGNQAAAAVGSADMSYWTGADFGPDVFAWVTLAAMGTLNAIWARVQGAGGLDTYDGYRLDYNNITNAFTLGVYTNASGTTINSVTIPALANGSAIGIHCHDNTIEGWYRPAGGSWTLGPSGTNATYPNAGKVALHTNNTTTRFDDFYAGNHYGGGTTREAWTSRGAGVQTDVTNTVAGWTAPIQVTDTAGGSVVDWFTRPLAAFTLGGAVRVNARESGTGLNCAPGVEIAVVAGDGSGATIWAKGLLPVDTPASEAVHSFLVSGNDLAVTAGQRLRIRFFIDDQASPGAMQSGATNTLYYAGAAGATGDTYLTFSQSLVEYDPGAVVDEGVPYVGAGYY